MNQRQQSIITYAQENNEFQTKDILEYFAGKFEVERMTIIRDLKFLVKSNLLRQTGKGRSVKYFFSEKYTIFVEINREEYFSVAHDKRNVLTSFNFALFDSLREVDIFTPEETEKLTTLQQQFLNNIGKYDSQTLINKEYERIMIEFSWKSSSIEGNTYSLLATEALLKENIADNTKTKEET